jgi:hypothetical protein
MITMALRKFGTEQNADVQVDAEAPQGLTKQALHALGEEELAADAAEASSAADPVEEG